MFKLIVFTWHKKMPNEIVALVELLRQGVELLHIRKPSFSYEEMKNMIEAIPAEYHKRIVLHDFPDLSIQYHLAGAVYQQRFLFNPKLPTGMLRCHSAHDLDEIFKFKPRVDYFLLSPVYAKLTDEVSRTRWSKLELTKFMSAFPETTVIAWGGVEPSNLKEIKDIGFKGAAVLGYLWKPFVEDFNLADLLTRYHEFRTEFERVR